MSLPFFVILWKNAFSPSRKYRVITYKNKTFSTASCALVLKMRPRRTPPSIPPGFVQALILLLRWFVGQVWHHPLLLGWPYELLLALFFFVVLFFYTAVVFPHNFKHSLLRFGTVLLGYQQTPWNCFVQGWNCALVAWGCHERSFRAFLSAPHSKVAFDLPRNFDKRKRVRNRGADIISSTLLNFLEYEMHCLIPASGVTTSCNAVTFNFFMLEMYSSFYRRLFCWFLV